MKQTSLIIMIVSVILLAACSQAATPEPTTIVQAPPPVVSASGKVLPARWATLSFQTGGRAVAVNVQIGSAVKAGDVLVQLDDGDARLSIAQAEAALTVAQAQLAQLTAGPQPAQIAAAEQAVVQANAAVAVATAQLAQLQAGARSAEIAAAEAAVAAAAEQKRAQDSYDQVREVGGWLEEQARAALNAANQNYTAAQRRLDQLKAGATKNELDGARANVAAAQAQQAMAQAQLDLLKAGPTQAQIAVAEANVRQAQVAVEIARAQLSKLQLVAPFDGTVGAVLVRHAEMILPGEPVIILGDTSALRVETTDLSELDVARVREGMTASVTFDALPGVTVPGKVTRIAPMSTPGQSGVNYVVIVEFEPLPPGLRWGMTAFVDIQVGQ